MLLLIVEAKKGISIKSYFHGMNGNNVTQQMTAQLKAKHYKV